VDVKTNTQLTAAGASKMNNNENVNLSLTNIWSVTCLDKDGNIKWSETKKNLITTEGLNHILDTQFHAGTAVTTWYIGLKGTGTPAAADTLASHSTWTEVSDYSGTRKEWTEGAASAGSMTNASSVDFSVTGTATVAGAFLGSATSGSTGTLYGVVDFASSRAVISGDTLQVTVTVTAASS
jgi:hypothetical protein